MGGDLFSPCLLKLERQVLITPKFIVIAEYLDSLYGRKKPGDDVEATEERIIMLRKAGVIGVEIPAASEEPEILSVPMSTPPPSGRDRIDNPDESLLKPVGGGYYILPNGLKVHGQKAALDALEKAGD
jgi:hypothetical protein